MECYGDVYSVVAPESPAAAAAATVTPASSSSAGGDATAVAAGGEEDLDLLSSSYGAVNTYDGMDLCVSCVCVRSLFLSVCLTALSRHSNGSSNYSATYSSAYEVFSGEPQQESTDSSEAKPDGDGGGETPNVEPSEEEKRKAELTKLIGYPPVDLSTVRCAMSASGSARSRVRRMRASRDFAVYHHRCLIRSILSSHPLRCRPTSASI